MGQGEQQPGFFQRLFGTRPTVAAPVFAEGPDDYSVLPEIAALLTNGAQRAVADMRLLADDLAAFVQTHRAWCAAMDYADFGEEQDSRQEESLLLFAYWLTGYPATGDQTKDPVHFGAFIDWKEETDDVIGLLEEANAHLGYNLNLSQVKFDYSEDTEQALHLIDQFLRQKGLTLTSLDTQSDCYHLFVLQDADFEKLTELAQQVGYRFFRNFA